MGSNGPRSQIKISLTNRFARMRAAIPFLNVLDDENAKKARIEKTFRIGWF